MDWKKFVKFGLNPFSKSLTISSLPSPYFLASLITKKSVIVSECEGKVSRTEQFSSLKKGSKETSPLQRLLVALISLDFPIIIFSAPEEIPVIEIFQSTILENLAVK